MNKKLIISLSIIGAVAAVAIGVTVALFNDTETSTGNILVAGTLDLKVDHLKETYNDADCKTCSVVVISDPTNMVVEKNGTSTTPYPAVYVGSNHDGWIHPAWTAQNDPELVEANAKWIWESDPTRDEDLTNNVTYTFKKEFEWWGPITGSDLWMAVGSDNSIKVWLNGVLIAENPMEFGYKQGSMLHIPAADIIANIAQGNNVLKFEVKNWALIKTPPATHHDNPAGLIYKFEINGLCGDDYFKTHCTLWGLKDLAPGDYFWRFDDVKPGDMGTNLISLHVYDNDGWACLLVNNKQDNENVLTNPEAKAGDVTENMGEFSQFINVFGWDDANQDGVYQVGETQLFSGSLANPVVVLPVADSTLNGPIIASHTKYVGLAWCFGALAVGGGTITCDGSAVGDVAQTDQLIADLTAYTEQWRDNANFKCSDLAPNQLINGGFETGDTTGWTITGPGQVVSSYVADQGLVGYEGPTYGPVEGTKFLVLTAGLGTDVYTIASQQVAMLAGQKIEGYAAYDAKDYMPFLDDAAVDIVISGPPLATPWSVDIATVGDYGETAWTHWGWTAPADGTYTLELKVRNTLDNAMPSSALFDANVVTP